MSEAGPAPPVAEKQIWTYRRRHYRIIYVEGTWTTLRRCNPETGEFDPKAKPFAVETAEFAFAPNLARYFFSGLAT